MSRHSFSVTLIWVIGWDLEVMLLSFFQCHYGPTDFGLFIARRVQG